MFVNERNIIRVLTGILSLPVKMKEIKANDPKLRSWIEVNKDSDFPIQNLPFGIFKVNTHHPRVGIAIGNKVLDLYLLAQHEYFRGLDVNASVFENEYLNDFIALGKNTTRAVRNRVSELLNIENSELQNDKTLCRNVFYEMSEVELLMPVKIGDYTDFYSSIDHATNVGKMFRDPANALLPNWKHIPVGYHGRSSSIILSGTDFHRPKGQTKADDAEMPSFGPSRQLDFELEMGFIIGKQTKLGQSISADKAEEYIFGMVLFNDWSARDIQKWEYVPLGPFLGKNFASTISPWVVTMDALEPFRTGGYKQEPEVLPYLKYSGNKNIDINLEVAIQPAGQKETTVCRSNYKYMYWTMEQQLAHHTVNGCNVNVGDLMASGTISGKEETSFGSMLELAWKGTKPVKMSDGTERKFINDGDTVILRGYAEQSGVRVGFGEARSKVLPAL